MLTLTKAQRTEQLNLFAPPAKPTPTIAVLPYRWGGPGVAIAIVQGSDRWDYPLRLTCREADALLAKCGKEVSRFNLTLDEEHGRPKDSQFLHRAIEHAFNRLQLEESWAI